MCFVLHLVDCFFAFRDCYCLYVSCFSEIHFMVLIKAGSVYDADQE